MSRYNVWPYQPNAAWDAWLADLQQREARGEVSVQWSRAPEPYCIHSNHTQPASACSTCKDGPDLAEWSAYWRSLGAPNAARPSVVVPTGQENDQ